MTQFEERRQQQIDSATATRARDSQGDWVKHTLNLRHKTRLNEIMESCGNKSHFVREMFRQMNYFQAKVEELEASEKRLRDSRNKLQELVIEYSQKIDSLEEKIAKLEMVITESFTQEKKVALVEELMDEEEEIYDIAPPTKSAMEQWADIQKGIYK